MIRPHGMSFPTRRHTSTLKWGTVSQSWTVLMAHLAYNCKCSKILFRALAKLKVMRHPLIAHIAIFNQWKSRGQWSHDTTLSSDLEEKWSTLAINLHCPELHVSSDETSTDVVVMSPTTLLQRVHKPLYYLTPCPRQNYSHISINHDYSSGYRI